MTGVDQRAEECIEGLHGAGSAAELADESFRMVAVWEFLLLLVLYQQKRDASTGAARLMGYGRVLLSRWLLLSIPCRLPVLTAWHRHTVPSQLKLFYVYSRFWCDRKTTSNPRESETCWSEYGTSICYLSLRLLKYGNDQVWEWGHSVKLPAPSFAFMARLLDLERVGFKWMTGAAQMLMSSSWRSL